MNEKTLALIYKYAKYTTLCKSLNIRWLGLDPYAHSVRLRVILAQYSMIATFQNPSIIHGSTRLFHYAISIQNSS